MNKHFELSITEAGQVRLYWMGAPIWEGPVSALKELEHMIGACSFHHEFSPCLKLHLSVLESSTKEAPDA